jgi:hypothetical protein
MTTLEDIFKCEDIRELRRLACVFYKEKIRGISMTKNNLGAIRFSSKGIREVISHSNDINKLKIIPYLKEIIETGKVGEWEKPKHPRKDRIDGFIPITNEVVIGGMVKKVEVLLAHDDSGLLFYDLYVDYKRKNRTGGSSDAVEGCTNLDHIVK